MVRSVLVFLVLTACGPTGGEAVDDDQDGFFAEDDCDDGDAAVNPAAAEACDGVDNDCDGVADDRVMATFYRDVDGDGFGEPVGGTSAGCTAPDGYVGDSRDCDDADPGVHPGATETCDGEDEDCDGDADEDVLTRVYRDEDADGHGDLALSIVACEASPGWALAGDDCDDTDPEVSPSAAEICNAVDDDCDGDVDDGLLVTVWADTDADGYGKDGDGIEVCDVEAGQVTVSGDCDDSDGGVKPGAVEVCDEIDQDCDGTVDDGVTTGITWYEDADGDGFGDGVSTMDSCGMPVGFVALAADCDDSDDAVNPDAIESCNTVDDDCDGDIDEDVGDGRSDEACP